MAIHTFVEDGDVAVWTDTEDGEHYTGRCIGYGETLAAALEDARAELQADLAAVEALLASPSTGRRES